MIIVMKFLIIVFDFLCKFNNFCLFERFSARKVSRTERATSGSCGLHGHKFLHIVPQRST